MMSSNTPDDLEPRAPGFLGRLFRIYFVGALFVAGAAALWYGADVLMLLFACILFAILLHAASAKLRTFVPVSRGAALSIVIVLLLLTLGIGGWLMAPGISQQGEELASAIPQAVDKLRSAVGEQPLLRQLAEALPPTEEIVSQVTSVLPNAGVFFSGLLGLIGNIAIILFAGIYFAAQPRVYIEGIVTLTPPRHRKRAREVLDELGETLAQWLAGKIVCMLAVGIVSGIGLALLGVPMAAILGIVAGLLDFIPYVGPIMAGVPAVLIAFYESPTTALYVVLLFVAIQTAEGYLLLPLVERRTVSLPPALNIMMQVLLGTLFGFAGVALATPLTTIIAVLVTMLYVQNTLHDPVKTPREASAQ